jgi:hypothetical protein
MNRLTPQDIIANLITKLKERFTAVKNSKAFYYNEEANLTVPSPSTIEERKKNMAELLGIVTGIESIFKSQEKFLNNAMRNQLVKLEIEVAVAYLTRLNADLSVTETDFLSKYCFPMLGTLFTRLIAGDSWFNCRDEEQCQRDLFMLYRIFSAVEQNAVSPSRLLSALKDKCDSNYIKVMTLFFLMVESTVVAGKLAAGGRPVQMRQLIAPFELQFNQTFDSYLAFQSRLGEKVSLRDKLELAFAHFNAYRYLLMCFNLNTKRKNGSAIIFVRHGVGVGEHFLLMPDLTGEANVKEILLLAKKESELRLKHLAPAFKLFPYDRYAEVHGNPELSQLVLFCTRDTYNHLSTWRDMLLNELKHQKFESCSPIERKFLVEYMSSLTSDLDAWEKQIAFTSAYAKERIQKNTTYSPEIRKEADRDVLQLIIEQERMRNHADSAAKTVQQEVDKFAALEKAAENAGNKFAAWVKAGKERAERIRQKRKAARVAAKAAQQGSPFIPPSQARVEKTDEEDKHVVVSLATVKSDGLKRLEFHDAKLSECLVRLMKATNFISRVLKSRIVDNQLIPFETMDLLKIKLNSTLSDFEALKGMRQRFSNLASSLSPEEFNELNDGITASLLEAKEKEEYFETALTQTSELLTLAKEKRENQRKEFIDGLGATIGESLYPGDELTPEERYELGYAEFVRRGRANVKKGLGAMSDAALERKYLRDFQTLYVQKLQTIVKKVSPVENVSKQGLHVSYPERIQAKWELIRGIPGDHFLFGNTLIDLLRGDSQTSSLGLASTIDFSLSCRTIGEVLDAQDRFHVSKYNIKQCRLNLPSYEVVNVFLAGTPLFFTCDGVVSNEIGEVHELIEGGLQDIKVGTLRTVQDAAATLKEHPQAVLVAVFRMSKGFVPDSALYKALFDWQPSDDLKIDYVKAMVAEHLKQLAPDDREEYVSNWNVLGLFQKIFKREMTLRELELLVLPPAPPLPFFSAKQEAPQAAVAASTEKKVVLG